MGHFPLSLLILTFLLAQHASALKILMYQTAFSPSHVSFSGALAEALIQEGHTVDKIIMEYNPSVTSNGSSKIRNVYRIQMVEQNPFLKLKHLNSPFEKSKFFRKDKDFEQAKVMLCEALITDSELISKLKAEKYDIYVTAAYEGCTFGFGHVLQIPSVVGYVATASMDGTFEMMGIPVPPSFVTSTLRSEIDDMDQLGFARRVTNFLEAAEDALFPFRMSTEQALFDKYFPGTPRLDQLGSRMSYLFLNTNQLLDISKPISAKVKFVGGIAMKKPKQLDQETQKILDIPSNGVVLFSFGSLVKTSQVPYESKIELLRAFKEFPDYTFLWKYDDIKEDADLLRNYSNVYVRDWLPQTELLYHPRIKLFISHMGLNSYLELSHAGVPAVSIPILADQFYNTGCAVKNGVALPLDKTKLTKQAIVDVLKEMLTNPRYTENAKQIAQLLAKEPEKIGTKKFVEYVEYAAEFPKLGPELLQMASAEMSVYKYACIDVMAFLLGCLMLGIVFVVGLARVSVPFVKGKLGILIKAKRA